MPANIAHMLIAHKVLQKLKGKGVPECAEFAGLLDGEAGDELLKAYVNLGSMGPDLFMYADLPTTAKDMLMEGYVQAIGLVPWSYQLHSVRPNRFPLELLETLFRDAERRDGEAVLEDIDRRKLAYVAGHLTHVAADQIIHPLVNRIAGPYYRRGSNRRIHREVEVFQDYFLYTEVYRLEGKSGERYDFFGQDFRGWADVVRGFTFRNTEDWFRYFLQRGFAQTYAVFPPEEQVEDSVDNLLLTLRGSRRFGPYRQAAAEFQDEGEASEKFSRYIREPGYLRHYRQAVELGVIYLAALWEMYARLSERRGLTNKHRERFLRIVSDADLSSPLKRNILEDAREELGKTWTMDSFVEKSCREKLESLELLSTDDIMDGGRDLAGVVKS